MAVVALVQNSMPREKWVLRITEAWQKQVIDIFEVGSLLEASREEIGRGGWMVMVREELPFGQSTANKLLKIAENENLRNSEHVPNLPAHWGTLYELTKLTEEQFAAGIENRTINPKMQRKDVMALRGIKPKETKKEPNRPSLAPPLESCLLEVRSKILNEWLPKIPMSEWPELVTELRGEIDYIEQAIEKRKSR